MGYTYQGPADTLQLEENGTVYRQGDNVPISKASAEHLGQVLNGNHRFEGVEVVQVDPVAQEEAAIRARNEAAMPYDDRGQQLGRDDVKNANLPKDVTLPTDPPAAPAKSK